MSQGTLPITITEDPKPFAELGPQWGQTFFQAPPQLELLQKSERLEAWM